MSGLDDLFGPTSSDQDDPFADIGRSPTADTIPVSNVNIDEVFETFDTSATSVDHHVAEPAQTIPQTDSYAPNTSAGAVNGAGTHYFNEPVPPSGYEPSPYVPAQQQSYAPYASTPNQFVPTQHYAPDHAAQAQYAPAAAPSAVNPYSSTQATHYSSVSATQYSPTAVQPTQTSPYAPTTFSTSGQHAPPAANHYAPAAQPNVYIPAATSTTLAPQTSLSHQSVSATQIPAPPAPRMPLSRPVLSNAYDPPFPTSTSKSSRKRVQSNTYTSPSLPPHRPPQLQPSHVTSPPSQFQLQGRKSIDGLPQPSTTGLPSVSPPNSSSQPSPPAPPAMNPSIYRKSSTTGLNGYHAHVERTSSPLSMYSSSNSALHPSPPAPSGFGGRSDAGSPPFDPYAPSQNKINGPGTEVSLIKDFNTRPTHQPTPSMRYVPQQSDTRNRSMSHGSAHSNASAEDPYAPGQHSRQSTDHGRHPSQHEDHLSFPGFAPSSTLAPPQEITIKTSAHAPYAPSPSLIGTNDPLGRTSARAPVFSFGFGGKLVTCFHGAATMNTGFDVALSSRNSTGIQIRILNKLIPQSALETSTAAYPGPLFHDSGSPTGLVRPGASAQAKAKKTRLLKYISEREQELSLGVGYLHPGTPEWRTADGKLVLVRLLKVLVEHDGRLSGSPQIENAVRAAFVPQVNTQDGQDADSTGFAVLGDSQNLVANETPVSVTTLRPSALDKVQEFLLKGQRRQAYHYALDEKLWAHAMIIASGIDKDSWKEVVTEFLKTELGAQSSTESNGREGLRVAYSLLSGQGASAVQELLPQKKLSSIAVGHTAPLTPGFVSTSSDPIPQSTLLKWPEIVAMMFSGSISMETSAALTALGDQLNGNQWTEAAHACYLLSSQTSPIGGLGHANARITLVGSPSPQVRPNFAKDPDSIIFSEILEFAFSQTAVAKGQDPFGGFPHLQAYKFIRATTLAELGDVQLASRYCDAIAASLGRASPYFTPALLEQLKGLTNRIHGVAQLDKAGSWMTNKLSTPSLDSIGGWLENRFTKLVTGDSENLTSPQEEAAKASERGFVGPFTHFSAISSTTTSTSPSPQPSIINPHNLTAAITRSGSAMSNRAVSSLAPTDRAASAMDYPRRRQSPAPYLPSAASAGATTTTFSRPPPASQSQEANMDFDTPKPATADYSEEGQDSAWWGASYGSSNQTPTATTFMQMTDSGLPSADGFISLMDNAPFAPVAPMTSTNRHVHEVDEEDEDLGFGNSKPREKRSEQNNRDDSEEPSPPAAPTERREPVPAEGNPGSGGWLSRWWRGSSAPKANLGEETSFYYDKDLKRWVNKTTAATEEAKPATPPPPPSRAQTASPGMTGHNRPPINGSTPPPARAASVIGMSGSTPPPPSTKSTMRVRSNLAPPPEAESAPSTPMGSRDSSAGPPPSRPRSQAAKRNVRSRYVDVFQDGGA